MSVSSVYSFSAERCSTLFQQQVVRPLVDTFSAIALWILDWADYFHSSSPLSLRERDIQRGLPPGIVNLGRSCYFNVVLQDLAAEPTIYTQMLNKQLTQKEREPLADFQLRQQFQVQLRTTIGTLQRGQSPSKPQIQNLMSQMERLGWDPRQGRELTFLQELSEWLLGKNGDSFFTYNYIRYLLEEEDFSIDRPHGGYFEDWDAGAAPRKCVIHLRSDSPNYIESLRKIEHIAPGQQLLIKITMPLEAQVSEWHSLIGGAGLYRTFHMKQIHVLDSKAYGAHTYIYKRQQLPRRAHYAGRSNPPPPVEEDFQWICYNDKRVSIAPIETIPRVGISAIVFSNYAG